MERLLHKYFRMLARYNAWANMVIFTFSETFDDDVYRNQCKSGKSIHGLLNEQLAEDKIWLDRLRGRTNDILSVGDELYSRLSQLREAQLAQDVLLSEHVDGLSEEDLLRPISYRSLSGESAANAQHELLTHLFTQQLRRRAELTLLLEAQGVEPLPEVTFLRFVQAVYRDRRSLDGH